MVQKTELMRVDPEFKKMVNQLKNDWYASKGLKLSDREITRLMINKRKEILL